MKIINYDVVVIGGGPAGLSAANAAKSNHAERVLIIERDDALGGILQQCIHPGFGLHEFKQDYTGPEYAYRHIENIQQNNIDVFLNTTVLQLMENSIIAVSKSGLMQINYQSLILAMGCRERTRGAIQIPGSRPAGVITAGTAQRLINIQGQEIGKNIVVLGSGDIGMIMARRLTLEGAKVLAVVELLPYLSGLLRNKVQCLDDFDIPLYLRHTVIDVIGNQRVESVTIAPVDDENRPIIDQAWSVPCDTLLLSVGLIPENELTQQLDIVIDPKTRGPIVDQTMQTSCQGVFACGNVVHVNDLVDHVSAEGAKAGKYAAHHALTTPDIISTQTRIIPKEGIHSVMPQVVIQDGQDDMIQMALRVSFPAEKASIIFKSNNDILYKIKRNHIRPGEIQMIKIRPSLFKDLDQVSIMMDKEL